MLGMTETEQPSMQLELETPDGRPIAYIGPHASLLPEMKSIICPLLGICTAVPLNRDFKYLKREFEWVLKNNATFFLRNNGQDERLQQRGLAPERVYDIGKSILNHLDNLSSYLQYRQASVQESSLLSQHSPMWGTASLRQTSQGQFPVLDNGEFRSNN